MRLNIGLTYVYIADNKNKSAYSDIDYPNIANRVIHFYIATSFLYCISYIAKRRHEKAVSLS
jgi:hypothetical protein